MKSLGDALSTPFVMKTSQIWGEVLALHAADVFCLAMADTACPEPKLEDRSTIWPRATVDVDSPGMPGMSAKMSARPSLTKTTSSADKTRPGTGQDRRIMASLPPFG